MSSRQHRVVLFLVITALASRTWPAAAKPSPPVAPERVGHAAETERLRRAQDYIGAFAVVTGDLNAALAADPVDTLRTLVLLNRAAAISLECGDHVCTQLVTTVAVPLARATGPRADVALGEALLWRALVERREIPWRAHVERRAGATDVVFADLAAADSLLSGRTDIPRLRGRLLQAQANAYRWQHGSVAALPYYEKAVAYREAVLPRPDPDLAEDLVWYAWNLNEARRTDDAIKTADDAKAELEALGMGRHTLMCTLLEMEFDRAALAGDLATCEDMARQESAIWERARWGYPFGYARGDGCPPNGYMRLLWVLLQKGDRVGAFQAWTRQQSPVTREIALLHRWLQGTGAPYRDEVAARYRAFDADLAAVDAGQDPMRAARTAADALGQWSALQVLLREHRSELTPGDVSADDVRGALRPGTAMMGIVDFRIGGKSFADRTIRRQDHWAVVIRPDRPEHWVCLQNASGDSLQAILAEDTDLLRMMRRAIAWPTHLSADPDFDARLRRQSRRQFGPVLPDLDGIETVISIGLTPDTIDDCCPGMPRQFVGMPSAATFVALAKDEAAAGSDTASHDVTLRRVLAIGATGAGGSLPSAEAELDVVAREFPGADLLTGASATEARLQEMAATGELERCDLIHFAGHVRPGPATPRRGLILNGGPRGGTSCLEINELMFCYELHPDLVVLDGCSTVSPEGPVWREYFGLAQSFLAMGARHVVATRWDVDDHAAELIMARFYENLTGQFAGTRAGVTRAPMSCAAALAEAERWLRDYRDETGARPYAHPVYWKGFVVYGLP